MNEPVVELLREEAHRRTTGAPPPPSVERVRGAVRTRRRTALAAGVTVLALLAAGGVGLGVRAGRDRPVTVATGPTGATPTPQPGPSDPGAEAAARARARDLLHEIQLPAGAVPVDEPPADALQDLLALYIPNLTLDRRFWTVPGTVNQVAAFFRGSAEDLLPAEPEPAPGSHREAAGFRYGDLHVTVAPVAAGIVGVRADARVRWATTRPHQPFLRGDPAAVELLSYRPNLVLRRATVRGEPARHLVDLVNTLPLGDSGYFCGLALHSPDDRWSVTLGSVQLLMGVNRCGAELTIDGVIQDPVPPSSELSRLLAISHPDSYPPYTAAPPVFGRVPGTVRSVDLVAYQPDGRVLAHHALTGPQAAGVGDAADRLPSDTGRELCRPHELPRIRLTITTDRATVVMDGGDCRPVTYSVDGVAQPSLAMTPELSYQAALYLGLNPVG